MAGLLDNIFATSADDPRYAANMALFGNMVKGDFGGGLLAASQAGAQARQAQLDAHYKGLLGKNMESEIAQREAKMRLAEQEAERRRRFMGIGVPEPSAGAAGPAPAGPMPMPSVAPGGMPGTPAPHGQPQSGGFTAQQISQKYGVPLEAVMADFEFNDGKEIAKLIEARARPNWQNINGNLVDTNAPGFQGGFQPGMNVSSDGRATMWQRDGKGGLVFGAPAGAQDTFKAYQDIQEGAKAGQDLVRIVGADGAERYVTRAQAVQASQPRPQPGGIPPAQPRPTMQPQQAPQGAPQGAFVGDPQVVRAAINDIKDPVERQRVEQAYVQQYGPLQATPTTAQKLSSAAGGEINTSWIKTSYEPTVAAGGTARDVQETVKITRDAMNNLGRTGWSVQAQAAGAAVLSGLGIAPQNAKLFAANAELFQAKAMERVNAELNAAKGPQTDQDAQRAKQTYAGLKNTPQANNFILDVAEAKAMRDQMKARFYQEAMPIAKNKGDLSEVDREWARRAPSIFSLPPMLPWAGGIK